MRHINPIFRSTSLERRIGNATVYVALTGAAVISLFPIYIIILTAFRGPMDVASGSVSPFFVPTLDNFRALFGITKSDFHFDLGLHFRNTVMAAVGSTLLSVIVGTPAAYAFARVRFRGNRVGMLFLLLVRLLPPIASVIPLYLIMRQVNLLDTVFALILAYTTFNLPFYVWMMYSFFTDLPKELEEAAEVDGASRWQTFYKIMLPLSGPGLAASAIFSMILAWNDFLFAVVLTREDAVTLPLLVSGFITDMGVAWGIMMAAGTVIVLPVLVFTLFAQKHLLRGMTGGAMKG
jgi:multiple sugar transport system permease protein